MVTLISEELVTRKLDHVMIRDYHDLNDLLSVLSFSESKVYINLLDVSADIAIPPLLLNVLKTYIDKVNSVMFRGYFNMSIRNNHTLLELLLDVSDDVAVSYEVKRSIPWGYCAKNYECLESYTMDSKILYSVNRKQQSE